MQSTYSNCHGSPFFHDEGDIRLFKGVMHRRTKLNVHCWKFQMTYRLNEATSQTSAIKKIPTYYSTFAGNKQLSHTVVWKDSFQKLRCSSRRINLSRTIKRTYEQRCSFFMEGPAFSHFSTLIQQLSVHHRRSSAQFHYINAKNLCWGVFVCTMKTVQALKMCIFAREGLESQLMLKKWCCLQNLLELAPR
jgi:hypothetical protein